MEIQKYEIISVQINIDRAGRKVAVAYNGDIAIKADSLTLTESKLTGGEINVDIASIKILDIADPATYTPVCRLPGV